MTSRHPPCCGATTPLVRRRRTPATIPAIEIARKTWRMNFTAASFRGVTHRPNGSGVMVGLTRIELVTSSLSGMRSNRLSYSPLTGLKTLSVRLAGLNRPSHHFFLKNGDPHSPHQFGDEVENNGSENPHARTEGNAEEPQNGKGSE